MLSFERTWGMALGQWLVDAGETDMFVGRSGKAMMLATSGVALDWLIDAPRACDA
jgi:hypothetical protein